MSSSGTSKQEELTSRVLYIAGNGRSGSTLLDLVLGNNAGCFSAGELTFISRDGILVEYCGCGSPIETCEIWREVVALWETMQPISISQYRSLRCRFELNRSLPRLIANLIVPSAEFKLYCAATKALFIAIQKVTRANTIVDSSKTPARIRVLSRFCDVTVIHLCRDFSGVLNSMSKGLRKNLSKGVETDLPATAPVKAWALWTLNNLLVELFGVGLARHRIHYRDLIENTDEMLKMVDRNFGFTKDDSISSNHMLAGNKMRLKPNITIDPGVGFRHQNLSGRMSRFGAIVDRLFWFWSKK